MTAQRQAAPRTALIVPDPKVEKSARIPVDVAGATPIELLRIAISQGADLQKIEKLMDLQDRWEANQARKAFTVAMTDFKKHVPDIIKDRLVDFTNREGKRTRYRHASLASVCDAVIEGLSTVGISHRWLLEQAGAIKVTCILTHIAGHSESTALQASADESGNKNSIQAVASTVSYLQRYTLLSATGLATRDMDDDGRGHEEGRLEHTSPALVTPEQIAEIETMIKGVKADRQKFLAYLRVEKLGQILACNFEAVMGDLKRKGWQNRRSLSSAHAGKPHAEAPRARAEVKTWERVPVVELAELIDQVGIPYNEFLANFELGNLNELPLNQVNKAFEFLNGMLPQGPGEAH